MSVKCFTVRIILALNGYSWLGTIIPNTAGLGGEEAGRKTKGSLRSCRRDFRQRSSLKPLGVGPNVLLQYSVAFKLNDPPGQQLKSSEPESWFSGEELYHSSER